MKSKFLHSQTLAPSLETLLLRDLRRGTPFNDLSKDEQSAVIEGYLQSFNWLSYDFLFKVFSQFNPPFRRDLGHWIFCRGGDFESFWSIAYPLKKGGLYE